MYDCFISYGRKESLNFVHKLSEALIEQGLTVWFDKNDIPMAVDFQEEINEGILRSHNFICVISPHSIQSQYVKKEIELAVRLKKRIIPVLHVEPEPSLIDRFLHPKLAKLNWVYFRDDVENFDLALGNLLEPILYEIEYVREHTYIQYKSNLWKANKKRENYLLFGSDRNNAQAWLEKEFETGQAPVVVTNLQCEYISQSRWLADRFSSDVYIISASEESYWNKKIKFSLLRQGKTVADRNDSIPNVVQNESSGFHITGAKYILYLISEESQNDTKNRAELRLAEQYNKPIIKVTLDKVDVPNPLGTIGELSMDDVQIGDSYRDRINELNRHLEHDDDYFTKHQKLLIRAKNWKAQKANPALLLRGNLLDQAQVWKESSTIRTQNKPVDFQFDFIDRSMEMQAQLNYDVYIAFAKTDYDFARYLNEELILHAKTTWFEHRFLSRNQFREAVFAGIEQSENIVCIVTNAGLKDLELRAQIGHARKLKKRVVLLSFEEISEEDLPINYSEYDPINFPVGYSNFKYSFSELIRLLNIDREHVQEHTIWLSRALKWEDAEQSNDLLLIGEECEQAATWLREAKQKGTKPEPTEKHFEFIGKSEEKLKAGRRLKKQLVFLQRGLMAGITIAFFASLFLAYTTNKALEEAEKERSKASRLYKKASANNLVALARQLEQKNPTIAMRLAEKADQLDKNEGVVKALYDIYKNNILYRTVGSHQAQVNGVKYLSSTDILISASEDQTAKVWNIANDETLTLEGHSAAVNAADASHKGMMFLTASDDQTIRLWNHEGDITNVLSGHEKGINYAEFSRSGKRIVSAGQDKVVILWSVAGDMLKILTGHTASVTKAIFSPNGRQIVSCAEDRTLMIWNLDREQFLTINLPRPALDICFASNGSRFAVALPNGEIRQYSSSGDLIRRFTAHHDAVRGLCYSPDNKLLAAAAADKSISIWTYKGRLVRKLYGHEQPVNAVVFTKDGHGIVSASDDKRIQAWDLSGMSPRLYAKGNGAVWTLYSDAENEGDVIWGDAQGIKTLLNKRTEFISRKRPVISSLLNNVFYEDIATGRYTDTLPSETAEEISALVHTAKASWVGTKSGLLRRYRPSHDTLSFKAHESAITAVALDTLSGRVLTGSIGRTVKLWNGNKLDTLLVGHKGQINALAFSANGNTFATGSNDGTIRLYSSKGQLSKVFIGHDGVINQILFSKTGKYLASGATDGSIKLWEIGGYEIKAEEFEYPVSKMAFQTKDSLLFVALQNGHIYQLTVPKLLSEFQQDNNYEVLSIAQMLELKIIFYEELKTEKELSEGGLFFYNNADLQPDRGKQLRYLIYADSLYQKLHSISHRPIYFAEHLQVIKALARFEKQPDVLESQTDKLLGEMIKSDNEKEALQAAKYLFNKAQSEVLVATSYTNYRAAEMLYRKLYLEYSKIEYLVGRFSSELMMSGGNDSIFEARSKEFETAFKQSGSKKIRNAAKLLFLNAETAEQKWAKQIYLNYSNKLYSLLLQKEKTGDSYVNLFEVLLHQQELEPKNTAINNRIKNLSVQLYSLKETAVIQDAADRFSLKAERESSINRKRSYLLNAETLYTTLYTTNPKAAYLISKRKALLGLKRLFPGDEKIKASITHNLKHFTSLNDENELLVATAYFDREVSFTTDKEQKISLLNLSLSLFLKLSKLGQASEYLGKMHRIVLELKKLDPRNPNIKIQIQNVENGLAQLNKEDEILSAITMYSEWLNENSDEQLQHSYAAQEAILYKKLLGLKPTTDYAKKAWNFSKRWQMFNPSGALAFQSEIWQNISLFKEEEEVIKWTDFILKGQKGYRIEYQRQIDESLAVLLTSRTWKSVQLKALSYKQSIEMAKWQILENAPAEAKTWISVAKEIDRDKPYALSLEVLHLLTTNGYDAAKSRLKELKRFTYNAKNLSVYLKVHIQELEEKGYNHPELEKLKKRIAR